MADDPNRDILPVKEGSCADTINSVIDPRERHLVCKLDRYQLEDKYLRVLDEMNNLKKLSNCQEDKIKRLGTKLIRLAGNPRSCGLALDIADDRTTALELENTKLKEKIAVMRNQLLSHTMSGRSSSRSRNLVRPSSSGLVTCRSENIRARAPSCQCIVGAGDDNNDTQNYLIKIEKLEVQKKDMACRIMELEKELTFLTNNQKEKVAENVEYIRVWRQMKQLNDKLMTTQEKNTALTSEINDLKTTLEQTTRNNQEIAAVLSSERTRMAEIDDQMLKAKNSQFTLREKDEQIRDLMNEIKILQQHNNELIGLTSKYGQVELENVELKKRLSEDAQEQQILKTAFNNEQANIVALKAANEQLLAKLQELQGNIDTLMVQLTSLYTQDKMRDGKPTVPPYTEQCRRCCEMYDKIMQSEKTGNIRENWQLVDKSVQTIVVSSTREQGTMIISNNEGKASLKEWNTTQETNGTNVLSREKILKLLDQAQINTPLDASRIAPKEEYASTLDVAQRHSDSRISSQHDASNSVQENSQKRFTYLENSNITLGQMFLILFDVLQGLLFNDTDKKPSLNCQGSAIRDMLIDSNNNNLHTIITNNIKQHDCSTETTKNFGFQYEIENSDDENSNNEELTLSTNATNKMSKEENGMITVRNLDSKMYNNNEKKENNASRDSPSVTELRTLLANGREKDAIIIEIVSMQLLNESCIMQDDEIQLLYIEYSFLGNFGEDMETVSVEKSKTSDQEMVYNYKKKFWINKATHPIQRDNLRAMLAETTSPNITFTIMSEPLPEEREVKDCKEVGYAIFNLKKYALGEEYQYILLPIKDNQNKQIGTLKIVVSGLNAIRQCLSELK
ncbi:intracellular protein transport protein USO1 isoform X5 [Monomorium pharaonis]|uniref:intracellular protein transport protein USO1 isoform X5 n=1 Tax=Monomorium pharaonis TaxID=307658 RepID=UPI001745DE93|nr:intracellular protein transport protein USO1 isoform X5 [Monomorium pharaonis]